MAVLVDVVSRFATQLARKLREQGGVACALHVCPRCTTRLDEIVRVKAT